MASYREFMKVVYLVYCDAFIYMKKKVVIRYKKLKLMLFIEKFHNHIII